MNRFLRCCVTVRPLNGGTITQIEEAIARAAGPRAGSLHRRTDSVGVTLVCGLKEDPHHGQLAHDVAATHVRSWLERAGKIGHWKFGVSIVTCPRSSTDNVEPNEWLHVAAGDVSVGLPTAAEIIAACPVPPRPAPQPEPVGASA
jgi:hypothetical protein